MSKSTNGTVDRGTWRQPGRYATATLRRGVRNAPQTSVRVNDINSSPGETISGDTTKPDSYTASTESLRSSADYGDLPKLEVQELLSQFPKWVTTFHQEQLRSVQESSEKYFKSGGYHMDTIKLPHRYGHEFSAPVSKSTQSRAVSATTSASRTPQLRNNFASPRTSDSNTESWEQVQSSNAQEVESQVVGLDYAAVSPRSAGSPPRKPPTRNPRTAKPFLEEIWALRSRGRNLKPSSSRPIKSTPPTNSRMLNSTREMNVTTSHATQYSNAAEASHRYEGGANQTLTTPPIAHELKLNQTNSPDQTKRVPMGNYDAPISNLLQLSFTDPSTASNPQSRELRTLLTLLREAHRTAMTNRHIAENAVTMLEQSNHAMTQMRRENEALRSENAILARKVATIAAESPQPTGNK